MKKNISFINNENLLVNHEFLEALKFEAVYAINVRGGHLPGYMGLRHRHRITNRINFLSTVEKQSFIRSTFISNN